MRRFSRCSRILTAAALVIAASGASSAATVDPRLIQAVRRHDVDTVRNLLKQRVEVNASQGDGSTALHWAARVDDLAIADLLIRSGARPNAMNDNGATPLHLACVNRSGPLVERLLASGADANATMLNGETALMTCARSGNVQTVKALLTHGARVNVKESAHDQTPLMWAAAQSHPDVVSALVEGGADIRARSKTYPQTVVGEQTQRAGREELNYTVLRGGMTPLLFAVRAGDAESVKVLITAGADPNDHQSDGASALVLAAHSGRTDAGVALLDKGANPDDMGIGYTALHAAVLRGDPALVKALLAHKADPNIRMTKGTSVRRDTTDFNLLAPLIGSTPYLLAARFLEPEIMQALKAGGADVTLAMPNGATPLMLAAGMGSSPNASRRGIAVIDFGKVEPESRALEGVTAAVTLGADVNAASQAGDTAMHAAAGLGYDSVVQYLADHGAQVNVKNKRGLTPLAALSVGGRGRGRGPAAAANVDAGADSTGVDNVEPAHASTAALLRKLGAVP